MELPLKHLFETVVYSSSGAVLTKSLNPSFEVARSVIVWKFSNDGGAESATVRNTASGEVSKFVKDDEKNTVSAETGEIIDQCPRCIIKDEELISKQRDIKAWQARYNNLKKALQEKAEDSEEWEIAATLFDIWRIHCKHEKSTFSFDRFVEVAPMLRKYGFEICVRAIAGASFDPYISTRKNGTKKVHNDFELIFRDSKHTEEYSCKAKLPFLLSNYTEKTFK